MLIVSKCKLTGTYCVEVEDMARNVWKMSGIETYAEATSIGELAQRQMINADFHVDGVTVGMEAITALSDDELLEELFDGA